MADPVEEMYDKYNVLIEAKDNISKHTEEYIYCLEGTKGTEKQKKLAAQIIQKFFKYFPSLQDKALNAIMDLCELDDQLIRISAMKVLPMLCKDAKEHVTKVADILAQLLQLEEEHDYNTACNSLIQVYKIDPVNTLKAIFAQINTTDDNVIKEKCVNFVYKKITKIEEKLSSDITDLLVEEGKKIVQDAGSTELGVILPYLITSKLAKTITGQQQLVQLVADRAEIDRDFDPLESGSRNSDRIVMCVDWILPVFNANNESTKFVQYYCDQILPEWDNIAKLENGSVLQYKLVKQLAELSIHCGKLDNATQSVGQIFEKLKQFMPLPPEDADIEKMPNLDFSTVECLLFVFHRLARQCPDFLLADPGVLKDFRLRLNYFSRGVGGCKRSLDKVQVSKSDDKIKIAPAVLDNIHSLIKDLFYTPPMYKCNVQLSFKTFEKKIKMDLEKTSTTQKRHAPIQFDSSNGSSAKSARPNKGTDNVKLYTPPSGKFSSNFQNYDRPRGGGRGRGRGIRGRGSNRNWRN